MARFEIETNIRVGRQSTQAETAKIRYGIAARIMAADIHASIEVQQSMGRAFVWVKGDAPAAAIRDLMTALDHGGWIN